MNGHGRPAIPQDTQPQSEGSQNASDLLRALAQDIDAGKPFGFVLLLVNHEDGSVVTPIYRPGNTHIVYSLLHDIADKVKRRAENEGLTQAAKG